MSELRALIWDVDGTLAETERDGHRVAFNQAFAEAGLAWHWDAALYRRLLTVTGGKERMRAWWLACHPGELPPPDLADRLAALHRRKTELYVATVAGGAVPLRPGVARLIDEARQAGLALAIATTTSPENVTALLQATLGPQAPGWFAAIAAGDEVQAKKPAPDVYRLALDRLGLCPHQALALEDSAPGAASAQAADVPVVVTRCEDTRDQALPRPPCADLDGLGEPGAPARGMAGDPPSPWQGVVDLATLRAWCAAGEGSGLTTRRTASRRARREATRAGELAHTMLCARRLRRADDAAG